jgi:hypothetical protein
MTARVNSTDSSAITAASQALAFERKLGETFPAPLGYARRGRRRGTLSELLNIENSLRRTAARMTKWQAIIRPRVELLPVIPMFERKGSLPSALVRSAALDSSFYLVSLAGELALPADALIASTRLTLEFDPASGPRRRPVTQALFPRSQLDQAGAARGHFGLRPNLTFWTPFSPPRRGGAIPSGEVRITPPLIFGPRECSSRDIASTGLGVGSSRLDLYFTRTADTPSGTFSSWFVLRVPGRRNRITVRAFWETGIRLPREVMQFLGSGRSLRDRRDWQWQLPSPGRLPSRRD